MEEAQCAPVMGLGYRPRKGMDLLVKLIPDLMGQEGFIIKII